MYSHEPGVLIKHLGGLMGAEALIYTTGAEALMATGAEALITTGAEALISTVVY